MDELADISIVSIDPANGTMNNKPSIDDLTHKEWRNKNGMSGGVIKFLSQGTIQNRTKKRYFVKMAPDTSSHTIAKYMDKAWKLRTPNIILSVISSPYNLKRGMNQRQIQDFQNGIIQAVNTTSMWIMTNGINSGVSKVIGNAIQAEKERRHLLTTNFSSTEIATSCHTLPQIVALGVVSTSELSCADKFDQKGDFTVEMNKQVNMSETVELNPDLTNYIMLDKLRTHKDYVIQRLKLEEGFQSHNGTTPTPLVGLLIQGSPFDIEHVYDLIKMKVPVIVVKGTGAAADLVAFAYDAIHQSLEDEYIDSYVKPELLKRIQKVFPKEFNNDVSTRNRCRDMIIECVQFASKGQQNFLTVLDVESDTTGLQNLDKYILLALFESQEPQKEDLFQQQIVNDLKLTLDWNRSDLALSQIFQKYQWINIKISNELFDLALIKRDRHDFAELFLDTQAIELCKYFNLDKLRYLINNYEDPEFFSSLCLGEGLGYSQDKDYPVNKRFVNGGSCGLNTLLFKTTSLSSLVLPTDFAMEKYEHDETGCSVLEYKSINTLVYWAALMYDPELTKVFWKRTEEPMAVAFIVAMIWNNIAKRWCSDSDTKRKLLASAKEFDEMAVNLLDYSYKNSTVNTIALLDKRMPDFNNKNIVELAHMAKSKNFIAHNACQKWLNRRWFGNLLIVKRDWGPVKVPNWLKIYLSLILIFPMFIWITFDLADKERRERIIEEELNENIDEVTPSFQRKSSRNVIKRWFESPEVSVVGKMRSAWKRGKERFKVPIHLQFYYLWSAPITKFWLNQVFYIAFLGLFSLATLHPNCGSIHLDLAVFIWILMIWLELVRSTISKWKKYDGLDMFWTLLEICVMMFLLIVIFTVRITPYFVIFFSYLTTKFLMSLGLLYFYYRVLIVFLPISPTLGPMLISIKRMITRDFVTWLRMFILIMVSGAITIHSVLYPNFPLAAEGLKAAFSRAFFAMFLTKIDDLAGAPCSALYQNHSYSHCYSLPYGSFETDTNIIYNNTYMEDQEIHYRRLAKCPYSSLGGYVISIQYLLIVKLILVTLLFALFSSTNGKVADESEAIWKFQKYSLIVDFEEKLILPPPLNVISYIIMFFQFNYNMIKHCFKKCDGCCLCCKRKKVLRDLTRRITVRDIQRDECYNYWKRFVHQLQQDEKREKEDENTVKTQHQMLEDIMKLLRQQQEFDGSQEEQISTLEKNVTNCQIALEKVQHTIENLNPRLQPIVDYNASFIHVLSRQSPYPGSNVQRFPVMDKYVSWQRLYGGYDPSVYTCPVNMFQEDVQPFVDDDYLQLFMDSLVTAKTIPKIARKRRIAIPCWNTASHKTLNGMELVIDRTSFMKENGESVNYSMDASKLPLNPKGRTGLRGRGRLMRWGPNHYVMVVITRWKKKTLEEFIEVDGKRLLEVVTIQKGVLSKPELPSGNGYGFKTMYSSACQNFELDLDTNALQKIKPHLTADDMIEFFRLKLSREDSPSTFMSDMIYRGYLDDPSNTDNAWKEMEVWNFHFDQGGHDIDRQIEDREKRWETISSHHSFSGSVDLILKQVAAKHRSYY